MRRRRPGSGRPGEVFDAALHEGLIGVGLLATVMAVSDCSFAGGTCPDPDAGFDDDSFRFAMLAGVLITAPPLLLARCRWLVVVGITLGVSLVLGLAAATG